MSIGAVWSNNRTQTVSLPKDTHFPEEVKQVCVRVVGKDRVLSPVDNSWGSFFLESEALSEDCINERSSQEQQDGKPF